ncbi:DUF397 domain-containing protein (plasmid) [Streptomyces sp. BI20]|uniref:DUF397 domain-containing protein n=1 Tax=Streptomyces sp. BI20 TaxID=3403460 RepID=UPI003C70A749
MEPEPVEWRKSSFSGADEGRTSLEAGLSGDKVVLREGEEPEVVMTTSRAKFAAFVQGVKAGEFDHLVQ